MGRRLALLLPLAIAACAEAPPATAPLDLENAAALDRAPAADHATDPLLRALRQATSRFHSTTLAVRTGYQPDDHCVPNMGFHWVDPSLVDPVFDPVRPEVMLYAPGPGGNLQLVAVEYIVLDVGQPRPSFGGRLFDVGGTPVPVPHWSQHVWLYQDNPDGMLTAFNPVVSCP